MNPSIKYRLKTEERDPDCEVGIAIFEIWAYDKMGLEEFKLIERSEEELTVIWARFLLECEDWERTAVMEEFVDFAHDYDADCDCNDSRCAEAEWYAALSRGDLR